MIGSAIVPLALGLDTYPQQPLDRVPGLPGYALPGGALLGDPSPAIAVAPYPGPPQASRPVAGIPGLAILGAVLRPLPDATVPGVAIPGLRTLGATPRRPPPPPIIPVPVEQRIVVGQLAPRVFYVTVPRDDYYLVRYSTAAGLRIDFDRAAIVLGDSIYLPAATYDVVPRINPNTGRGWVVYMSLRTTPLPSPAP